MRNKCSATTLLFFISLSLVIVLIVKCNTSEEDKIHDDGKLGLVIDKVEETNEYPVDWRQTGYKYSPPNKGYVYYIVHFNIKTISDIHVVSLGGKDEEKSSLVDMLGNKYELSTYNVKGWSFAEPEKGFASPSELTQGAKGILIFSIPVNVRPEKLFFVYYFKENWTDKKKMAGKIDIVISN